MHEEQKNLLSKNSMEQSHSIFSEIDFPEFIDLLSDSVLICKEGRITGCNKAAESLLKLSSRTDLTGRDAGELLHLSSDYENLIKAGCNPKGLPLLIENHRICFGNGLQLLLDIAIKPNRDTRNVLLVLKGKSEPWKIERDTPLHSYLLNFMEKSPNAIFVYCDNIINYLNSSAVEFLGITDKNEVIGRDIRSELKVHEDYVDIISERVKMLNAKETTLPFMEQKFIRKDGLVFDAEVGASSFLIDGKMSHILICRNVTERKFYEQVLRESEERYRKLVDLLPDGLFITEDDEIIWANRNAAKLLGFGSPSDLIGRNPSSFIPKFLISSIFKRIDEIKRHNCTSSPLKHKLYRNDGQTITVESIATAFNHNGNTLILTAFRDLNERLKLEEFRKKAEENRRLLDEVKQYDKLKTEFFANLSHEVRTPINVILSSIQLISRHVRNCEIECNNPYGLNKQLATMRQNCNRLLKLFNNLIDITRIDSGFIDLNIKNHNIVSLVEEVSLSVSEYIENRGISITFDTEVEERIVAVDSDKIERIMLNLLSNATKFTNPGGSIAVNLREYKNFVEISVKDSGVGIPEDKLDLIFERFVQVDKSFTRNQEGSGIGLSIVKSLIELHGGSIEVKSKVNEGSEFTMKLPLNRLDDDEIAIASIDGFDKVHIEFSDISI